MKRNNSITDIPGIEVGQAQDDEALTGCTVILCRKGAVGGVDVRGSAPGTRETDLLNPINLVEKVHAVVLAGGSAFGLDAASGVMKYLAEQNIGYGFLANRVPIVPAAILFDLGLGKSSATRIWKWATRLLPPPAPARLPKGTLAQGSWPTCGLLRRCLRLLAYCSRVLLRCRNLRIDDHEHHCQNYG